MSNLVKTNIYFNKDTKKYIRQYNKNIELICFSGLKFGGSDIRALLGAINYILLKKRTVKGIYICFKQFEPKDKLTYIILEAIIAELVERYNKSVYINLGNVITKIHTRGLKSSLLIRLANKEINYLQFIEEYKKKNHLSKNSFRRNVEYEKKNSISELMSDIKSFLRCFNFDKNDIKSISRLVSELADNACEHGNSNCIIEVDVTDSHYKKNDKENEYYAINICALNFSSIILGDALKNKLRDGQASLNLRYSQIKKAYESHKQFFDRYYMEEHFFSLASMQNNISGRENEYETGGRGLAEIVKELELNSNDYKCYVLFGNKVIWFEPEYLNLDCNNFISFNKNKDFLYSRPSNKIIGSSDTYLEGTGYNLTLVYKKEIKTVNEK